MNQVQVIKMMESVLPAIVKSGDPEGELLKCASEHNLPIAQVEKLGQVFNTYKTLTGLSVQKNRGDAHSIVDVPSMVEKYASFNPKKVLKKQASGGSEGQVKYADSDGWKRMFDRDADSYKITTGGKDEMLHSLRDIMDAAKADIAGGVVSDNQNSYREFHDMKGHYDITFGKSASARLYKEVESELRGAEEDTRQIAHEIKKAVAEKCASIMGRLNPDEGRWAEAVEDIYDVYGDDAANAVHTVENYFSAKRHRFTPVDLTKRAFAQPVVEDRHGVFADIEEIMKLDKLADRMGGDFFKSAKKDDAKADGATDGSSAEKIPVATVALAEKIKKYDEAIKAIDEEILNSSTLNTTEIEARRTRRDMLSAHLAELQENQAKAEQEANSKKTGLDSLSPEPISTSPASGVGSAIASGFSSAADPAKALLEGMRAPLVSSYGTTTGAVNAATDTTKAFMDAIGGDKFNSRKRKINLDKAKSQAKMDTALQQLMLSDPVISKADPVEVQNLFSSLQEISPALASNPTLMGPTLKEALQYGGIPIQLLTEVSKFNESYNKSHNGARGVDSHE